MSAEARPLAALTGASGFLGRHLVAALHARGYRIRVLTRQDPVHRLWSGVDLEVVPGALEDEVALRRLCRDATVVIHAAGLIKARGRDDFLAVNREGTARLARIARAQSPAARFLLVSSLAAREPHLSHYANSKHAGEQVAAQIVPPEALTIVRPPAIYGPGDMETLVMFKAAKGLAAPLATPAGSRAALVHVHDAAAAIAALAWTETPGRWTLADTRPEGHALRDIMSAAARTLGTRPRFIQVPGAVIHGLGAASELWGRITGKAMMLTRGKAREITHRDWGVRPEELPPAHIWQPSINMQDGVATTTLWYRDHGHL